jgi:hypothetical protein
MSLEHELRQFTGSEHHYRHRLGFVYTDGVKYLAEKAGAYWLLDVIGSYQERRELRAARLVDFQLWELKVNDNKTCAVRCFEDSGMPPAIEQQIEYTDFPLASVKLYLENGCLMLPSER